VKLREANSKGNKYQYECKALRRLLSELEKEILTLKNRDAFALG